MDRMPWLTLVIAAPLVGLPVLALWRSISDDAARWVGLGSTVVAFAASVAMLVNFETGRAGLQMVSKHPWVESIGLSWFVGVDGFSIWLVMVTTFMFPIADRSVVDGRPPGAPVHGGLAVPRDGDPGCVPRPRSAAVLPVLRGPAVPDVLRHRRLGLEAAGLCGDQVPAVHDVRIGVPARRHPVPVGAGRGSARPGDVRSHHARADPALDGAGAVAVPRVLHRVRREGAGLAAAHLAARRPHRGADQGLDRARGDPAEDGPLRHAAVQPGPVPRGLATTSPTPSWCSP